MTSKVEVKYLPREHRAIFLFPGFGSTFEGISVWEWEPHITIVLDDFRIPGTEEYRDGNGDPITKEEAQQEVDAYNGR